ncbi:MAG TPA: hypothetical protein VMU85_01325 [Stellaceae bacterium]|nr:hypothetical protein [Stellaceae bacterium]
MVRHAVAGAMALGLMLSAGGALAAGMSMAKAKSEIVTDGYTNVQNLKKTDAGWTASALESGKPVSLLVDRRGDVEKTK